jgi:imidazoleglycerol-phosphate dehydratase
MRCATFRRTTAETSIELTLNLDGEGQCLVKTGMPFFNHMLHQFCRHGLFDLTLQAQGDLEIDGHHTVEDIGICLGFAFHEALGDKTGIERYGHAYVPLDESLARVVADLSGRPGLFFRADFSRARVGDFDSDLVYEFFQGFVNQAKVTLHIDLLFGRNSHHEIESVFKAFARALKMAVSFDPRQKALPSTKEYL